MSGPKGGSYHVETAAQREVRMRREAKADYARAQVAWDTADALLSAARAVCGEQLDFARPAAVPAHADSAAYTRAAADLEAAAGAATALAREARERAATASHASRVARIIEHLGDESQPARGPAQKSRWEASRAAPTGAPQNSIDRARIEQRIQRRLDDLASLDHDAVRVQELIGDIAAAGSQSRIDLIFSELDFLIADARKTADRAEETRTVRAELAALQARIADIPGFSDVGLRARIAELIDSGVNTMPAELPGLVGAAVEAADAEADRLHVVAAMTNALEMLGYSVGPGFSTDLSGAQGVAYARKGSSGYGIKVRLEPESARFTAQAVKSDITLKSAQEDLAAEGEFCTALNKMIELAKRDGVELDIDTRAAPGAYSVQQVVDAQLGAAHKVGRTAGSQRDSLKEMKKSR